MMIADNPDDDCCPHHILDRDFFREVAIDSFETEINLQRIREYELQYEKSVQEMRELAILARKQIAAELRGRDNTPAGDYDEEGGHPLLTALPQLQSLCLQLRLIAPAHFIII